MARIKTYIKDNIISEKDFVIGSDFENDGGTKNYTIKSLVDFIQARIVTNTNIITSVFGRTGVIISSNNDYTKSQIGLPEADNTSDLNKPISIDTQIALDNKLDKTSFNEHYKSQYLTEAALILANPTGSAGDYAQVNEVGSNTVVNYSWDTESGSWIVNEVTGSGATSTDTLPEGTANLYWTVARFLSNLTAANIKAALGITTLAGSNTGDQTPESLGINLKADKTELAIKAIDEGNGIGYVIASRNPLNYGTIGLGAVDLSFSSGTSTLKGATGETSFASGYNIISSGFGSFSSGAECQSTGQGAISIGITAKATNYNTIAIGGLVNAIGQVSVAIGNNLNSRSFSEVNLGLYNTDYTVASSIVFNPLDRIFGIGNGTTNLLRSDALIILKNGLTTLPSVTNALITAEPTGKAVVTKEYLEDKIPSLYSDSISSKLEASTTSITDVSVAGMTITPPFAGTYKVDFNGQYDVIPGNVCTIASLDLQNMYLNLLNIPSTGAHGLTFGSGETISAGIYTVAGAMSVAGTLTLDGGGNPNSLFVFRVTGAINTAISTTIQLTNGANAANVFFMAIGAVGIGAENVISGNFIAYGAAAALGANCIFNGRLFSTSGALAFSSGIQSKPTSVSVINMGILENFLCFTNGGNVANTALAVITGDLGTNFGLVTVFATSVFNGNAYDDTQQLGSTNVFSLYSGTEIIENSSRLRRYYNYTEDVVLSAVITVLENQQIGVKFRTDVGRVILNSRILTVVKI